ncbi:hypothetical protein [Sulfurovum sp. TSL1]|uniref:hypothetical protein n=1 Tax=Sulfurovum sp. TSL1 TaxID=2826994 RepID=UPI001CC35EFD|nr:hypothetical protein [Sulfurovum sp. TSL1]GIT99048.1 hypothetical protein TSL1_18690 [Sulfurovum sp. TSL1]
MDLNEETIEDTFNINTVLETLFSSLKSFAAEKRIELIYEMDSTIPRRLRGDSDTLLLVLSKVLTFVFQKSDRSEIVLSLSSVEDFLYEEFISFRIQNTNIEKEKLLSFLKIHMNTEIELLGGHIVDDLENISDLHLSIPFKNFELGFRRHYRLPDKNIVGKKILLLCSNDKIAQSLKTMFRYFHYDVHIGMDEFKKHGNDLALYDILIVSEKMVTEKTIETIDKVQGRAPLKYVQLRDPDDLDDAIKTDSENFVKPITQEKIFDLIISLYDTQASTGKSDTTLMENA